MPTLGARLEMKATPTALWPTSFWPVLVRTGSFPFAADANQFHPGRRLVRGQPFDVKCKNDFVVGKGLLLQDVESLDLLKLGLAVRGDLLLGLALPPLLVPGKFVGRHAREQRLHLAIAQRPNRGLKSGLRRGIA